MNLGFLASHNGSNMQAIIDACMDGRIAAKPTIVISNNSDSGALEKARKCGIPAFHISKKSEGSDEAADIKIAEVLSEYSVDLLILAGYMRKIGPAVLKSFPDRIVNIHPALLPKFGGQGMYGMNVHNAVIAAKETETGATIHLVNNEYDQGRILAQRKIPVLENDTAESLAKRVLEIEHRLYVQTIADIAENKIKLSGT